MSNPKPRGPIRKTLTSTAPIPATAPIPSADNREQPLMSSDMSDSGTDGDSDVGEMEDMEPGDDHYSQSMAQLAAMHNNIAPDPNTHG